MYKFRRWSLPGTAVMPVLNVSSRVTWLELDDKALLDSYAVLQEGILCNSLYSGSIQNRGVNRASDPCQTGSLIHGPIYYA